MSPAAVSSPERATGLFRRIYATFVITVMVATTVAAIGTWLLARGLNQDWIGDAMELLSERHDTLTEAMGDPAELSAEVEGIGDALDTRVVVYDHRGRKLVGEGPPRAPRRFNRMWRGLEHGRPKVHRPAGGRAPIVLFPLVDPVDGRTMAVVHVVSRAPEPWLPAGLAGAVILLVLGGGAWLLSRSLTRRIGRLERSAERIARGDLAHRVALYADPPRDEVDQLGVAFNEMAEKVETLVQGQRTLLANVSHELRTPIARIKVLIEILEERTEALGEDASVQARRHVERLREGLAEMGGDTREIEHLISDLLTSGRLQLGPGAGGSLELEPLELHPHLGAVAERFGARIEAPSDVTVVGDPLLLSRLWSNLLANARRACPDGDVAVVVVRREGAIEIAVEDEGPGIDASDREAIFEPFTRLDAARARDAGGVGLGLYLSRQIARAHGGEIRAQPRPDGRRGARLVVTLPAARKPW